MSKRTAWLMALTAALALTLAVAADESVFVVGHDAGDIEKVDLSELADGETRTFGEGEDTVTASRSGDTITIRMPRGPGDDARSIDCTVGSSNCFVIVTSDATPGTMYFVSEDGEAAHLPHGFSTWTEGTEGDHSVIVRRLSGGPKVQVLAEPGKIGPNVKIVELSGGMDVSIYECPEGDTTMRLAKNDTGPYFCPKHSLELEKSENPVFHHRDVQVFVETDETE